MTTTQGKRVEILVVEDDANDAELILHALEKHGLTDNIFVARDGEEALDFMFARGKFIQRDIGNIPKVVFMDLKLPKVDGLEVVERMKADKRTAVIPVVMLTSSRQDQDVVRARKLGVSDYIVKPLQYQKFVDAVVEVGKYWIDSNGPQK